MAWGLAPVWTTRYLHCWMRALLQVSADRGATSWCQYVQAAGAAQNCYRRPAVAATTCSVLASVCNAARPRCAPPRLQAHPPARALSRESLSSRARASPRGARTFTWRPASTPRTCQRTTAPRPGPTAACWACEEPPPRGHWNAAPQRAYRICFLCIPACHTMLSVAYSAAGAACAAAAPCR